MVLNEIGRVCVKLAGRDAGQKCVIVDVLDNLNVLIDGQTRRRKCNVLHLHPTKDKLDISKGADSAAVRAAFKTLDIEIVERKPKQKAEKAPAKKAQAAAPKVEKKAKKPAKKKEE